MFEEAPLFFGCSLSIARRIASCSAASGSTKAEDWTDTAMTRCFNLRSIVALPCAIGLCEAGGTGGTAGDAIAWRIDLRSAASG